MVQYFSKVTAAYWTTKNKLEKEAREYALQIEHLLINDSDLHAFKSECFKHIEALNKKHQRCKPLIFYPNIAKGDKGFFVSNVFHLSIYPVKKIYENPSSR